MTTRPLVAVVDDDRVFTEMVRDFLESEGFATVLVRAASDALVTIAARNPAVVLLDIRMEEPESGREILDALRAAPETAELPVVVCTADQQFLKERDAYLRANNVTTIEKPFDLDALLSAVTHAMDRSNRARPCARNGDDAST